MSGWSAVGGQVRSQQTSSAVFPANEYQTQSPYIKGGVAKNATWITNTVRSPDLPLSHTSLTPG